MPDAKTLANRVQSSTNAPWRQKYRTRGLWRTTTLDQSLRERGAAQPRAPALIDGATTLHFGQLREAVLRCAAGLQGLGVEPGAAVAYQLPNWWEAAVTLLATVRLGAHAVPIVPFLRPREVAPILAQTQPCVFVSPERIGTTDYVALLDEAVATGRLPGPRRVLVRPAQPATGDAVDFANLLATAGRPEELLEVDPSSLSLIIYTSGTSAAPKGAMHTHQTLDAELGSLRSVHGLGPDDRVLMPSPLTHISGVIHGILGPALLGTSAVLMEKWEPGHALELIERHQVTYMVGAPTFLQEMLAHPDLAGRRLDSLRLFSCGGATVSAQLMRQGRRALPALVTKRVYGSSEFPTISTTAAEDAETRGLDSEGRALPGVELRICDPGGRPQPPGIEGEVRARGPECFVGYVDAALDQEAFDDAGFLRTGDLGVLDEQGYLTITGRLKDIIVRKGEKISAREVEDLITLHPAVAEAAVIALPDTATGERVCACVRAERGATLPTFDELISFLRARDLTSRKLPEKVVARDDFPRTPSGKIHKKKLRDEVLADLAQPPAGR